MITHAGDAVTLVDGRDARVVYEPGPDGRVTVHVGGADLTVRSAEIAHIVNR